MATVGHQTTTEEQFDGTSGAKIGERTLHQLGITVDGVFIPFLSKDDDWVQSRVASAKAQAEAEKAAKAESKSGS